MSFQLIFIYVWRNIQFFNIEFNSDNLIFATYLKIVKRASNPFAAPSTNLYSSEPLVSVRKHIEKRAKDAGNKTRTYKEDGGREERGKAAETSRARNIQPSLGYNESSDETRAVRPPSLLSFFFQPRYLSPDFFLVLVSEKRQAKDTACSGNARCVKALVRILPRWRRSAVWQNCGWPKERSKFKKKRVREDLLSSADRRKNRNCLAVEQFIIHNQFAWTADFVPLNSY